MAFYIILKLEPILFLSFNLFISPIFTPLTLLSHASPIKHTETWSNWVTGCNTSHDSLLVHYSNLVLSSHNNTANIITLPGTQSSFYHSTLHIICIKFCWSCNLVFILTYIFSLYLIILVFLFCIDLFLFLTPWQLEALGSTWPLGAL